MPDVRVQCPVCEKKFIPKELISAVPKPEEKTTEEIENDVVSKNVYERLTKVERRILHYITEGGSNKEVAKFMATSEQVVKNYMRSIFDKTGQDNRVLVAVFVADHPMLRGLLEEAVTTLPN